MKVLLVEDHPIVRAGCLRVLQQREGLEVLEAETAAKGSALAAQALDLIVLDLNLPDRRGLDVLGELAADHPGVRVIVLSMYEEVLLVTSAMEAGCAAMSPRTTIPNACSRRSDTVMAGQALSGHGTSSNLLARARIAEDLDLLGQPDQPRTTTA